MWLLERDDISGSNQLTKSDESGEVGSDPPPVLSLHVSCHSILHGNERAGGDTTAKVLQEMPGGR